MEFSALKKPCLENASGRITRNWFFCALEQWREASWSAAVPCRFPPEPVKTLFTLAPSAVRLPVSVRKRQRTGALQDAAAFSESCLFFAGKRHHCDAFPTFP
jgi:hypothetical protein